jgi:hypothetical protein
MDGLGNAQTRRRALEFGFRVLAAAESIPSIERAVSFGPSGLRLSLTRLDPVGELIDAAFLHTDPVHDSPSLTVLRHDDLSALPDAEWARTWVEMRIEVPQHISYPYRILFDRVVGVIYVLDQISGRAAIWIRHPTEIDVRSLFTPFRIMLSWLANRVDAEVLHAAGVVVDGWGLVLSGDSGSGKSTLALSLAAANQGIVADDCLLLHDGSIHAIYSRAKVDLWTAQQLGFTEVTYHPASSSKSTKGLVALDEHPGFCTHAPLRLIGLPVTGFRTAGYVAVSQRRAYQLVAGDTLREVIGGSTRNRLRLARLARSHRAFRLMLARSLPENVAEVRELIGRIQADENFSGETATYA